MVSDPTCARCGYQLPSDALFCPGCGANLRTPADGADYANHPEPPERPQPGENALHRPGQVPPGTLLRQRYFIDRKLAQGGHSAVYLARDTFEDGKAVALKEMRETQRTAAERDTAINSFMREQRMLAALQHPALARVLDMFVEEGHHYLVMEYVPGYTLEDEMMAQQHPIEWSRAVGWGIDLCDVLAYLHHQQPPIVYRDLKPPNVMVTPDGQIKLIDFGIARWFYSAHSRDTTQLGTDGYAPPEQYAGRSEPRSDLYALGASLYHLLTGRIPESAPQRLNGQPLTAIRAHAPTVPEVVERVVQQALSLTPADRFVSAEKMGEALTAALQPERPLSGSSSGRHPIPAHISPHIPPHIPTPIPDTTPRRPRASTESSVGGVGSIGTVSSNGSLPKTTVPPRLLVRPLRIDAGYIPAGETTTVEIEVANRGGGALAGQVDASSACLRVAPKKIDGKASGVNGVTGVTNVAITIATAGLPVGPYVCHVAVRTNGGDQMVPIRFAVTPPDEQMRGMPGWLSDAGGR